VSRNLSILCVFTMSVLSLPVFAQPKELPPGAKAGGQYVQNNNNRTDSRTVIIDRRTVIINNDNRSVVVKPSRLPDNKKLPLKTPLSIEKYFEILKDRLIAIDSYLTSSIEGLELAQTAEVSRVERSRLWATGTLGAIAGACTTLLCLSDAGAQFVHANLPSITGYYDTAREGIFNMPFGKIGVHFFALAPGAGLGMLLYIIGANLRPDSQDPMLTQAFTEVRRVDSLYKHIFLKGAQLKSVKISEVLAAIHKVEKEALLRIQKLALIQLKIAKQKDGSGAAALEVQVRYAQALAAISSLTATALHRIEPTPASTPSTLKNNLWKLATACSQRSKGFFDDLSERTKQD